MAADMRNGFPTMAHTGAAARGMVNLTMTLAYEWAVAGVRVNAVSPGWIALLGHGHLPGRVQEKIPKLKGYVPLGRLGTESEVSAAVCFLLSDASAYITGTELRIDGGVPLGIRSIDLPATDRSRPFRRFHLARTPKVAGRRVAPCRSSRARSTPTATSSSATAPACWRRSRSSGGRGERAGGDGESPFALRKSRKQLMPRERIALLLDRGAPFLELMPLAGLPHA